VSIKAEGAPLESYASIEVSGFDSSSDTLGCSNILDSCAGMCWYTLWHYQSKTSEDEDLVDLFTWSEAEAVSVQARDLVSGRVRTSNVSENTHVRNIVAALHETHSPVVVGVGNGSSPSHSVLAYRWDSPTQVLTLFDYNDLSDSVVMISPNSNEDSPDWVCGDKSQIVSGYDPEFESIFKMNFDEPPRLFRRPSYLSPATISGAS